MRLTIRMRVRRAALVLLAVLPFVATASVSRSGSPKDSPFAGVRGPYLGQRSPGTTPVIFAPGLVSAGLSEQNLAPSPDGRELFFRVVLPGAAYATFVTRETAAGWTEPVVSPFYTRHDGGEFFVAPDGRKLFFRVPRVVDGKPARDCNIWWAPRERGGWGAPQPVGAPVCSDSVEGYPTVSSDGTLYFYSNRADSRGGFDLYCSRLVDGRYTEPANLGDGPNSPAHEFNPCIAPDGSYLLFNSPDRPGGLGGHDLWVSFRMSDGTWSKPVNLGPGVNSSADDYSAVMTADGRYVFFGSRRIGRDARALTALPFGEMLGALDGPGNGNCDIYWMDAAVIEGLRPRAAK